MSDNINTVIEKLNQLKDIIADIEKSLNNMFDPEGVNEIPTTKINKTKYRSKNISIKDAAQAMGVSQQFVRLG